MTDDSPRNDVSRIDALASTSRPSADGSNRRRFLRGAAASLLAGLGFSGTAAAIDPTGRLDLERAQMRYDDPLVARRTFDAEGAELLALLADRGLIETPTVNAVADDLRVSATHVGETATGRIEATTELDDGDVLAVVEPEADRRYAIVERDDQTTILDPSVGSDEIDAENCYFGDDCMTSSDCDSGCRMKTVYCCNDGSCYTSGASSCCEGTCYTDCSYVCW